MNIQKALFGVLREMQRFVFQKRARNNPSIISRDCCGGVISHECKRQFASPTVDLFMSNEDFLLFCSHLQAFVATSISPVEDDKTGYPMGRIDCCFGSVLLHFMHYSSFESAVESWERRKKRIDYDNICILMDAGPYVGVDCIQRFSSLPFDNKVLLSSGVDEKKYPCCINMKCYEEGYRGSLVAHRHHYSLRRYLFDFNFIDFINRGGHLIITNEKEKSIMTM